MGSERLLPKKKIIISTISSILPSPKTLPRQSIHYEVKAVTWSMTQYRIFVVLAQTALFRIEMFLAAESDGCQLFPSLMNTIPTIIYKIECSLLVLVDRLKRCTDFSIAKPRSYQGYGFRSGKCHSVFKIQIKISCLKAL